MNMFVEDNLCRQSRCFVATDMYFGLFTDGEYLRKTIERQAEKKPNSKNDGIAHTWMPNSGTRLLLKIEDMHMPRVDSQGTQEPIEFLKQ